MLKEELKIITIKDLLETGQISTRTANCCYNYKFNSLYDLIIWYKKFRSFFNFKFKNAGHKTCRELDKLCKTYILEIEEEKESIDILEDTVQLIKKLTIQERDVLLAVSNLIVNSDKRFKKIFHKYSNYCSEDFASDFYQRHCYLPMVWILEQYIKNVNTKEIDILVNSFNIIKNHQLLTLDELATKHDLTRERIRQIRVNLFNTVFKVNGGNRETTNSKISNLDIILQSKRNWSYLLEVFKNSDILCHESFEVENYLKEEKCGFSNEFFLNLFASLFSTKYRIFGAYNKVNKPSDWVKTFVIRKEYAEIFDFEKLRVEFSIILMSNESDYLLSLEDYIANSQCWKRYDYTRTSSLIKIVRELILYEFCIYSEEIDGKVKIPANREKKPIDMIYDILYQAGRPMHIDEIFNNFKIKLPNHKYTQASQIRPYLQKHEAISFRNRKSVYTLKEWNHIKTGTIRDVIVEFLLDNSLPQSAEDITKFVLKYFPETNVSSVRTSILNDNQSRFAIYNKNLFGLISKEYPFGYEISESTEIQRKSFSQRIFDMEKFLIENKHFPFSSSLDKNEKSLYRWWTLIIKGTTNISQEQKTIVERILFQYSEYEVDKDVFEWNLNYKELKHFLLDNRRKPSTSEDEIVFYRWLKRANEDFHNNKLTEEQRKKFITLIKLI